METEKIFSKACGKVAAAVLAMMALAACASLDTVAEAPLDAGVSRQYDAPYRTVAQAAEQGVREAGIQVDSVREDDRGLMILASQGASLFSWGEVVRVFVARSQVTPTTVYLTSEKRAQMQITGTTEADFAEDVFTAIDRQLAR